MKPSPMRVIYKLYLISPKDLVSQLICRYWHVQSCEPDGRDTTAFHRGSQKISIQLLRKDGYDTERLRVKTLSANKTSLESFWKRIHYHNM